ncbi:MAG: linear amide C-N hydrolase [bacterium]|nr:linear amide C-N hydrolase [bacterium]
MRIHLALILSGLMLISLHAQCTCFSFDTPEGPVFGANLELFIPGDGLVYVNPRGIEKEGFQASSNGATAKWVSKYGSVTFNLAGREFAAGGMNEAGLVVGALELKATELPEPDDRPPLPIGTWVQYVLDTCDSVDDVIKTDSKVRIEDQASPSHFLIVDAEGDGAVIEFMDGKLVYYTGPDMPVKALTYMRYERALASLRMGGPRWWWSNPGESAQQFAKAEARNKEYNPETDGSAVRYAFTTLSYIVGFPITKWNIVYDINKREVWYRTADSTATKHITMSKLDLSCESSYRMLDVNEKIDGDVEEEFIPYDSSLNLRFFKTFCERSGIDISEEDAIGVTRHIDRFKCAE